MNLAENPASTAVDTSFNYIVDETCERLKDKQVQYSIRRIHEMEDKLSALEHELEQFLVAKSGK